MGFWDLFKPRCLDEKQRIVDMVAYMGQLLSYINGDSDE